jgi:hypothetical protein
LRNAITLENVFLLTLYIYIFLLFFFLINLFFYSPQTKSMSGMLRDNLSAVNLQLTDNSTLFCARVIHPGLPPESIGFDGRLTFYFFFFNYLVRFYFAKQYWASQMC